MLHCSFHLLYFLPPAVFPLLSLMGIVNAVIKSSLAYIPLQLHRAHRKLHCKYICIDLCLLKPNDYHCLRWWTAPQRRTCLTDHSRLHMSTLTLRTSQSLAFALESRLFQLYTYNINSNICMYVNNYLVFRKGAHILLFNKKMDKSVLTLCSTLWWLSG